MTLDEHRFLADDSGYDPTSSRLRRQLQVRGFFAGPQVPVQCRSLNDNELLGRHAGYDRRS